MPSGIRIDPIGAFNFYLTLIDTANVVESIITATLKYAVASFSECSGLESSLEVFEYKEGGLNDYVHKFPTRISHANVTLKRGVVFIQNDLWNWHSDFVQGKGKRKDGLIVLLNESGKPAKVWKFLRGLPMKWTGPTLNAGQSNVAIETLEIAHEGLIQEV